MKQADKVILITNIPTPYRIPFWDKLYKSISFSVLCISKKEKNRNWDIEERKYISFLKSYHLFFTNRDFAIHFSFPFALFLKLYKLNPEVVIITGYDSIQFWEALLYSKIFKKKSVLWSGTTLLSSRSKNKIVNYLKAYFINSFSSYYTYGNKATEYLEKFGAKKHNITTGTNTVDIDYFKKNTDNFTNDSSVTNFLYVGQLIERKGLENTIKAFSKIDNFNWLFTIVGTGKDEMKLKNLVKFYNLDRNIILVGFKQKDEILQYYSESDVFIMPSYNEVWGLVLNEALASGLFCLSSKYAGSSFDLIEDGVNGYIIDPYDIDNVSHSIIRAINTKFDKKTIKNSIKSNYDIEVNKLLNSIKN